MLRAFFYRWRILSRTADAFMTVDDEDTIGAMKRLADPNDAIPRSSQAKAVVLVSQRNCCFGSKGACKMGRSANARIFLISTEGVTDPRLYSSLV